MSYSEGKFTWLRHVMRREPPSMLYEEVKYKLKGTRPQGRPRTTDIITSSRKIQHERCDVPEYVPGPTCLVNTLCRLTGIRIPTWRFVSRWDLHILEYFSWTQYWSSNCTFDEHTPKLNNPSAITRSWPSKHIAWLIWQARSIFKGFGSPS